MCHYVSVTYLSATMLTTILFGVSACQPRQRFHVYIMVTDRGPNEALARKAWTTFTRDCPNILSLSSDCYEHAGHLVTLGTLKTLDEILKRFGRKWKFFSSIATCSHTLRDLSKGLYQTWRAHHGDLSGWKLARKLWPKVVGGRRNSCREALERMRKVGGQTMLKPVLDNLLLSKAASKKPTSEEGLLENDKSSADVDEISYQETQQFQIKMGRRRKQTQACVDDALWWVVAEMARIVQSVMVHFSEPHV